MNARVFLLVLISALFMGAWNGDQKAMQAAIARREARREAAWAQANPQPSQTPQVQTVALIVPVIGASEKAADVTPVADEDSTSDADVPLPPTIAGGEYRAVSQSGVMRHISVGRVDKEDNTGRDFYTVDAKNGERWYLIRVR